MYDSRPDTEKHIARVRELLNVCRVILMQRAYRHDESKLEEPEKSSFDLHTENLSKLVYGSDEYRAELKEMKPALDHHYATNSHHPEHYLNGINDMSLFDLVEMLMDWKAASERHETGDIRKSIDYNQERFEMSEQLAQILQNTVDEMGWK
jgi:hypothetical protein